MSQGLYYTDSGSSLSGLNGPWSQLPISKLISSILEPVSPREALRTTLHLVHLLLLSNHPHLANTLLTSLYELGPATLPLSRSTDSPLQSSLALENFWLSHPSTHPRPEHAPAIYTYKNETAEAKLKRDQWGKFRECTFTGWMLEHCNLREPKDPHCWRETDEPKMIAMCCRLLAKTKRHGEYVSLGRMREALAAARKLYALPQVPIDEFKFDGTNERRYQRHSALVYRRLAMELAIRVGDLDAAASILSQALKLDGLGCNGGSVDSFLTILGVWEVLPLLNKDGKAGNPYFISGEEAEVIVREIISALELRAEEGRQWSLAPEKVTWRELLDKLAKGAWKVNRKEYRRNGVNCKEDILNEPATEEEIEAAEKMWGELPRDFKEMVRVANGFKGGWHFLSGGFTGISNLTIADAELEHYDGEFWPHELDVYKDHEGEMIEMEPAVECDCFQHFLIPPKMWKEMVVGREVKEGEYQYWHTASWQGTASHWDTVWDWVASLVEDVEAMVEKGEKVEHYVTSEGGQSELESADESDNEKSENEGHKVSKKSAGNVDEEDGASTADVRGESEKRKATDDGEDDWVRVEPMYDEMDVNIEYSQELL